MRFKIPSLIAIGAAALALGVPPALADAGLGVGETRIDVAQQAPDWFERAAATAVRKSSGSPYRDAFERPGASIQTSAPDWFERAAAAAVRDASAAPYLDAFERPAAVTMQTTRSTSSTVDSGTDIAWGQIGLAFGLGLLIALGLSMALTLPRRAAAVGHEN